MKDWPWKERLNLW